MRDFLENLTSPSWWLGVVLVGIAVNFLSAWLMRGQAAFLSRISKRIATRTQKRREERNKLIQEMRSSAVTLQIMTNRTQRNRSLASLEMIFGFQGLIGALIVINANPLASLGLTIFAGYLTVTGLRIFLLAENQYQMLQAALSNES